MKKRFHVKKRTLLLIAGIVWLIAGFNVARLGILSYRVIDRKWYLYLFSVVVFFMFGMMFYKMSKKHTKRILGYESHRPFWHFFDLKAYLIMVFTPMASPISISATLHDCSSAPLTSRVPCPLRTLHLI